MLPFLVFLGIPLLGVLIIAAERTRRIGQTPGIRRVGKVTVAALSVICGFVGAGLAIAWVTYLLDDPGDELLIVRMISSTTFFLGAALILLAARSACRVGFGPAPENDAGIAVAELARGERNSDSLRLCGWLLILVPLLQLGVVGLFLLFPIAAYLTYAFAARTARQARQSHFLWVLALAVERDMPVDDEIEAFAETLWRRNRNRYKEIANRIREGRSLVDSLELSGVLPAQLVSELRIAQTAGTLSQALRTAAANATGSLLEDRGDRSIATTAMYAWIMLVIILNVVAFILYWIVPKYVAIFNDFEVELPEWTLQAISLGNSFASNFLLVTPLINLPILVGISALMVAVLGWDNLNFPLLMRWFPRWDAPGVLRSLAWTVEAGRPVPPTFEELAAHARRADLRDRFARLQQRAETGDPLWTGLCAEGFVDVPEAGALEAAARANNLEWALRNLADSLEGRTMERAQLWFEFVKPVVVLSMGCVVAFFVIAFFLPLVTLIQELL